MDSMATDNDPRESDTSLSYRPTDPILRDSPALVHLQRCIIQVTSQALASGHSLSLVQTRLAQHQTQFDAFLGTLDGIFRPRDADLMTPVRNDNVGAASLDATHEQASQSILRTRQSPKRPGTVTADNAAASAPPKGDFTDTPQSGPGNLDGSGNRTRRVKGVAAQQGLSDEEWRTAHFGTGLDDLPESFDNIAHQPAQIGHDSQGDTELPDNRLHHNKKRKTSQDQVDAGPIDPPGIGDPAAALCRPGPSMSPISPLMANVVLELHRRGEIPIEIWILGKRKAGKPLRNVEIAGAACQYGNMRRCREKGREECSSFDEKVVTCISRHRFEVQDCL